MKTHASKCAIHGSLLLPTGNTIERECDCDGYHTFTELYDHRIQLFICLCDQITNQPYCDDKRFGVWRSKQHSDGSSFDGWFVMGIGMGHGKQITYHLPLEKWDECSFAKELDKAPDFDGHTSDDVLTRLKCL